MGARVSARHRNLLRPAAVAASVVLVDQWTKAAITAALGRGQSGSTEQILGSMVQLEYVENRGAAFGVLRGQGSLVSLLALVVLTGLTIYYVRLRAPSPWLAAAVGMIFGGSAGNLIDRARLGYVVDFVAVGPWPKFNIADSAITVGVAALAVGLLVSDPVRLDHRRAAPGPHPSGSVQSADGP